MMFARFNAATGALIADRIETQPPATEGEGWLAMPPSAIAGGAVWSETARGYVDPPPPPMTPVAALAALLVTKAVITEAEATRALEGLAPL